MSDQVAKPFAQRQKSLSGRRQEHVAVQGAPGRVYVDCGGGAVVRTESWTERPQQSIRGPHEYGTCCAVTTTSILRLAA